MPLFPIPDDSGNDPDLGKPNRDLHLSPSETGIDKSCEPQNIRGLRLLDENGSTDDEVVRLINSYLEKAFSEAVELSVADRLGRAFLFASENRETQSTTDEKLRDAERYLYGLAVGAQRDQWNAIAIAGSPLYEGLKYVAHGLKEAGMPGMEKVLRSSDGKPTSKASWSAIQWADKGLKAGLSIDGERRFDMSKPGCGDTRDMRLRRP